MKGLYFIGISLTALLVVGDIGISTATTVRRLARSLSHKHVSNNPHEYSDQQVEVHEDFRHKRNSDAMMNVRPKRNSGLMANIRPKRNSGLMANIRPKRNSGLMASIRPKITDISTHKLLRPKRSVSGRTGDRRSSMISDLDRKGETTILLSLMKKLESSPLGRVRIKKTELGQYSTKDSASIGRMASVTRDFLKELCEKRSQHSKLLKSLCLDVELERVDKKGWGIPALPPSK